MKKEKTGFEKCNVCMKCEYLSDGNCTATKEIRTEKRLNKSINCEFIYQMIKYMEFTLYDPEEIKKREIFTRDLSYISVEDMFRPFTI